MPEWVRPIEDSVILIAEDSRTNTEIIRQALLAGGFHHIHNSENGKKALQATQQLNPDLVILDILMPEMDGFEYIAAIRDIPKYRHTPIIVQTSLDAHDDKMRAFSLGASDFISKPFQQAELLARIRVHLNNKLLQETLNRQKERMASELIAAQAMQKKIMPPAPYIASIEQSYRLGIAEYFETCSLVGGDCWGLHPLSPTRLAVHMFDFSGHGVTAALNVFRLHTLMQEMIADMDDAGGFLTRLGSHLYPLLQRHQFATMFYGIINIEANCLEYATAASPPVFVAHAGNNVDWLARSGIPLGATPDATYPTRYSPFASGSALVLFSDYVMEATDAESRMLQHDSIAENVIAAMAEPGEYPAASLLQKLLKMFKHHHPLNLEDDLTFNIYYRK